MRQMKLARPVHHSSARLNSTVLHPPMKRAKAQFAKRKVSTEFIITPLD